MGAPRVVGVHVVVVLHLQACVNARVDGTLDDILVKVVVDVPSAAYMYK